MTLSHPSVHDKATSLRDALTAHLQAGRMWPAAQAARQLLQAEPGARTNRFLRKALESSSGEKVALRPFKVALLSSFSIEFLHDALVAQGLASGLKIEIYQSKFGVFRQELLDQQSDLYAMAPNAVVLAVEREAWLPTADLLKATPEVGADRVAAEIARLAQTFRTRSAAPLLVHNFALPVWPHAEIGDTNRGESQFIYQVNRALGAAAASVSDTYVVDYAGLVSRTGALNWYDDRMRLYASAPLAQGVHSILAAEYLKFFRSLSGLGKKCLVVDLDNTLWGGILGEDGVAGIKLGTEYPGNAFVEFQRQVLQLKERGVILAIASKNNPGDVDEAFIRHPQMVLKPDHFTVAQVGWQPKTESLQVIARRLNIGLDQLVFADDNPFECEQVREALPMVTVVQLPPEPEGYVGALLRDGWFDSLAISDEDRRRGDLYSQRDAAEELRATSANLEDFYRELRMELTIAPVDPASVGRAAQLTQKTNQFNVTTRRYSETEIVQRSRDPAWIVRTIRVRDKFGDNGIVGLMMARVQGASMEMDTFLLSCRVIGRTVETAMLAALCREAERRGLKVLIGEITATSKNEPVRDLYERHGFSRVAEDDKGTSRWSRSAVENAIPWPAWFRDSSPAEAEAAQG